MKMKNYLLKAIVPSLIMMAMLSCSSEDEVPPPPKEEDPKGEIKITLTPSRREVKLFEITEIGISGENKGMTVDSIVWDLPGMFKNVSTSDHSLSMMSQTFIYPGYYTMTAVAYHNGDTIAESSTKIKVIDETDFLGINWKDTEAIKKGERHHRNEVEKYYLTLEYHPGVNPYAILNYEVLDIRFRTEEFYLSFASSRKLLTDYITNLYGFEPKKIYEGEDIALSPLFPDYNLLFKTDLLQLGRNSTYYPLAIWQIGNSNIALIGEKWDEEYGWVYYKIIAEPRK